MIGQTPRSFRGVKTRIMFFLKRLLYELYRKVLCVKLTMFLWVIIFTLVFVLMFIWTFGFTSDDNAKNDKVQNPEYPVIVWWTDKFYSLPRYIECPNKCEIVRRKESKHNLVQAYLFYGSHLDFDDVPLPRRWDTVLWGLLHEESPRNTMMLMHEKALELFNYSSTFSRYSDYPFPLQYLKSMDDLTNTKYAVETTTKNDYLDLIAPIIYVQTDCESATERDKYVEKLMEIMKVDSYGQCLNNKELPAKFKDDYLNNMYEENFMHFVARYKFMITIENGVCEDYITEKLWRALIAGTVPIYFGSPSVRDWLPNNNSAILLEEFPSPEILKKHLDKLLNDDALYESYLEHKTKRVIANRRLIEELKERPRQFQLDDSVEKFQCLICERLHKNLVGEKEHRVVNKSHYDCPKPISALTLAVNPDNFWVAAWHHAAYQLEVLYKNWGIK